MYQTLNLSSKPTCCRTDQLRALSPPPRSQFEKPDPNTNTTQILIRWHAHTFIVSHKNDLHIYLHLNYSTINLNVETCIHKQDMTWSLAPLSMYGCNFSTRFSAHWISLFLCRKASILLFCFSFSVICICEAIFNSPTTYIHKKTRQMNHTISQYDQVWVLAHLKE